MQKTKILFSLILVIVLANIIFVYFGYQIFKVETESLDRRQSSYQLSVMNLINKRLENIIFETENAVNKKFFSGKDIAASLVELQNSRNSLPFIKNVYVQKNIDLDTGASYIDRALKTHKQKHYGKNKVRYFELDGTASRAFSVIDAKSIGSFIVIDYNVAEITEALKNYIKEIAGLLGAYIEVTDRSGKLIAFSEKIEKAGRPPTKDLKSIFTDWKIGVKDKTLEDVELQRKNKIKIYIEILVVLSALMIVTLYTATVLVVNESTVVKLRSDFVSTVSHDLKTPLTSIKMYAELLKGGRVKEKKKLISYLNIIVTESERLSFLINNVLEFSRREYRQSKRIPVPVDLGKVAKKAIQVMTPYASRYGYKIRLLAEKVPLVPGDEVGLNHLIMNLLDNAIKYSPKNKIIVVEAVKEGEEVRLSVKDRGIGIEEKERQAIFEKFYRSSDSYVKTSKGIGIGLSIVKQIALEHKARIELTGKKGKGSTFSVFFKQERT